MPTTHLQAKHAPAPTAAPAAAQFSARGFEEETEQVEEQAPETKAFTGGNDAPSPPSVPTPPPGDGGSVPTPGDGAPSSNFNFLDMPLRAEEAGVQAKLTMGQPGDRYEREADQTAAQVMRMPDPQGEDPLETEAGAPEIQQRGKGFGPASTAQLQRRLNQQAGKGTSLPKSVQSFMAPRFGQDFGQVRVHTDSSAVQMNKELGAQAFTHGNDIYFNQGKYSPGSSGGRELLAHELTHTIQQTGGIRAKSLAKGNKIQAKLDISAAMPGVQMREGATPAPTPAPAEPQSVKPEPDKGEEAPEAKTRPASISPEQDPGFVAVTTRAKGTAEDKKTHKPSSTEAHDAQDAAVSPANEVESIAQDQHMGEMQQEEPGSFDAASFVEDVLNKVEGLIPDTEEKAENFPEDNELNTVRDDLSSDVEAEQEEAAGPIEETNAEDPDTSGVDARESDSMEDMPPGTAPGDLGAKEATPKPKPDSEVSDPIEEESKSLDQQMEEANVTEEQLANSNEPEFTAALDEKQKAKTNAEQAPGEYREGEAATLNQAEAEACGIATSQTQGMQDSRVGTVSELTGLKGDAKGQDEGKRQEIADHIDGIYERVKGEVETALNDLDTQVMDDFDNATDEAKRLFEDYVDREIKAYKNNRYWDETYEQSRSGIENVTDRLPGSAGDHWFVEGGENLAAGVGAYYWGSGRAVDDLLTGMPPEFNQIFADGKTVYMNHMSTALTGIANLVTDTLNDAKQKIANGKQEISAYVASLPSDLQDIGQEAADSIQSKFNDLEQQVNDKRDELVTKLADKYAENLEELDERIEQLEAENSGLINRALNAMGGVIQQILEIKALLEQVFAGAQGVIESIIQDPIGFLNNLITGLTQGFNNFLGNIVTHLQSGLIGWLTGTLGSVGLEMPEDIFSLKGIFSLTTQVLGLTWDYVRSKAVRMFGEPTVSGMEQGSDLFITLKNDGPSGMWNEVQGQFTDLKQTVMDEIQNMLITEVIRAGVKWVLGLLTPATAFIKAGMMIFDIIMFFIENAQQIMALVESIIASVSAVAGGDTNQMAVAVEDSLATSLPVAIGFLAALLGLGGLTKRVRRLFEAIRERVDAAIEWVLEKAKRLFKERSRKGKNNEEGDTNPDKYKDDNPIPEKDHPKLARQAISELKQSPQKYEDYQELRKAKQDKAKRIEANYTRKLKQGIKLSIRFQDLKTDKEDNDLKFKVIIAPNTTVLEDQVSAENCGIVNIDLSDKADRPSWRDSTKRALQDSFPDLHVPGSNGKLLPGNDRRHIVAYDLEKTKTLLEVNGRSFEEAAAILVRKGSQYKPSPIDNDGIKEAVWKYLCDWFNNIENLWVGAKGPNASKGAKIGDQGNKRLLLAPDTEEHRDTSRNLADATLDTGWGEGRQAQGPSGRDLTRQEEQMLIDISIIAERMGKPSNLKSLQMQASLINTGAMSITPSFMSAQSDLDVLNEHMTYLRAIVREVNDQDKLFIDARLMQAVRLSLRLTEALNTK